MNEATPVLTNRTVWVGVLTAIVGVLSMPEVRGLIPLEYLPHVLAASGILMALLRMLAPGPIALNPPKTRSVVKRPWSVW